MCYHVLNFAFMLECIGKFNTKVSFSQNELKRYVPCYIPWHPVCLTPQSALHFTPWHSCSFWQKFGLSGKHSAMLQLLCEDFTHENPAFYHIMLADIVFADFIL